MYWARTYENIDAALSNVLVIEKGLSKIGDTPFEALPEEEENAVMIQRATDTERHLATLSSAMTAIVQKTMGTSVAESSEKRLNIRSPFLCRRCYKPGHRALECPDKDLLCEKCKGPGHRTVACGVRCGSCKGMGHFDHECQNRPASEPHSTHLTERVVVEDEADYLDELAQELNLAETHTAARLPKRRTPFGTNDQIPRARAEPVDATGLKGPGDLSEKSKIRAHFMKGRVTLSPLECIMKLPGEMEYLEDLIKAVKKNRNSSKGQSVDPSDTPPVNTMKGGGGAKLLLSVGSGKAVHLTVEIAGQEVSGQVDSGATTSVLAADTVRELGMLQEVTGTELYRTASGAIEKALGRLKTSVMVGGVSCYITFLVVSTNSYDMLLGYDFLRKMGAVVDFEQSLIQIRRGPGEDKQVLPLNEIHQLTLLEPRDRRDERGSMRSTCHLGCTSEGILCVEVSIEGRQIMARIDSGSSITVCSLGAVRRLDLLGSMIDGGEYCTASGTIEDAAGNISTLGIHIGGIECHLPVMVIHTSTYEVLLGCDFLQATRAVIDFAHDEMHVQGDRRVGVDVNQITRRVNMLTQELSNSACSSEGGLSSDCDSEGVMQDMGGCR